MYYDLSKALSYQAFLNFLLGERGCGKTYSTSKFITKQFINKGEQFAYIRRYKTELQKSVPKFFDPLIKNDEFPNHKMYTKGDKFYIDDKIAGFSMTLSTAQNLKSTNFPNVKYIVFDEFIIEEGQSHYLKNEVEIFLGLIETIARMREVKVFMLANAITITNPYFIYFDVHLPYNNDIATFKDGLILVQYMKNEKYREEKRKTKFGKLIEGTEFGAYAIDNQFRLDNNHFIEKKTSNAKCNFTIAYLDYIFGVWFDWNGGKIYISFDHNNDGLRFACTNNEHKPNTLLISTYKNYHSFRTLIKNYQAGNVYYENVKVKNLFHQALRPLLTR